jgi:hypothetical protein
MKKEDIRNIIRESLEDGIFKENADGNYMAKQNIESILKSSEIINSHIQKGESQEDWVEDKLSKVAENMRSLRDYFENNNNSDSDDEIEENISRNQTNFRGTNKKPANYPWIKGENR